MEGGRPSALQGVTESQESEGIWGHCVVAIEQAAPVSFPCVATIQPHMSAAFPGFHASFLGGWFEVGEQEGTWLSYQSSWLSGGSLWRGLGLEEQDREAVG